MPASFARKLAHFIQLSELELAVLRSMPAQVHDVQRDVVSRQHNSRPKLGAAAVPPTPIGPNGAPVPAGP